MGVGLQVEQGLVPAQWRLEREVLPARLHHRTLHEAVGPSQRGSLIEEALTEDAARVKQGRAQVQTLHPLGRGLSCEPQERRRQVEVQGKG